MSIVTDPNYQTFGKQFLKDCIGKGKSVAVEKTGEYTAEFLDYLKQCFVDYFKGVKDPVIIQGKVHGMNFALQEERSGWWNKKCKLIVLLSPELKMDGKFYESTEGDYKMAFKRVISCFDSHVEELYGPKVKGGAPQNPNYDGKDCKILLFEY